MTSFKIRVNCGIWRALTQTKVLNTSLHNNEIKYQESCSLWTTSPECLEITYGYDLSSDK